MWTNFKDMPFLLKLMTLHALTAIIMILGALPGGSHILNGQAVTYQEWIRSGTGVTSIVNAVLLPLCGVLFLRKQSRSRHLYLGVLIVNLALTFFFFDFGLFGPSIIYFYAVSAALIAGIGAYLFSRRPVKEYFEQA